MPHELMGIPARMAMVPRFGFSVLLVLMLTTVPASTLALPEELQTLPPPVLSSENFPCSRCHATAKEDNGADSTTFHQSVRIVGHTEGNYDCFDCHDRENLDKLRLFNGGSIDLADSSPLCGQCHSTNYSLWQKGLHGKVIGSWKGGQVVSPCTTCHDPHRPRFQSRQPVPPPAPPEKTLRWRK